MTDAGDKGPQDKEVYFKKFSLQRTGTSGNLGKVVLSMRIPFNVSIFIAEGLKGVSIFNILSPVVNTQPQ